MSPTPRSRSVATCPRLNGWAAFVLQVGSDAGARLRGCGPRPARVGLARGPRPVAECAPARAPCARAWPLLAAWVLVHVLEAVSVIGLVLPLAVMTWFLVTAPVIGAEGLGPVDAMRRSARLVSRRFWMVLGAGPARRARREPLRDGHRPGAHRPVRVPRHRGDRLGCCPPVIGILTQLITMPVVAGITVLIYLDLRVRTEGLDLELDAIEAFPSTA